MSHDLCDDPVRYITIHSPLFTEIYPVLVFTEFDEFVSFKKGGRMIIVQQNPAAKAFYLR